MSAAEEEDGRLRQFVRPYAVTRGRTRPAQAEQLEIETLISTTARGEASLPTLAFEARSIAALCMSVQSIAEVAARLRISLGVARVLVGDMAEDNLVAVYRPLGMHDRPDLALLERVLHGLREI
jgi:Protein of unknown function (DUF742)